VRAGSATLPIQVITFTETEKAGQNDPALSVLLVYGWTSLK